MNKGLPVSARLVAVAVFVVAMLGVAAGAHWLFYEALPLALVGYVSVGLVALFIGSMIGEKAARQHYVYGNRDWPLIRVRETYEQMAEVDPVLADGLREKREQWRSRWPLAVALSIAPAAVIIGVFVNEFWPR